MGAVPGGEHWQTDPAPGLHGPAWLQEDQDRQAGELTEYYVHILYFMSRDFLLNLGKVSEISPL